jgi:N-acetylglutamate synthase-like GNAT family acetyltransferase
MPIPKYQIRRATLDDVPQLRKLWAEYQFSVHDLERRFTEFKLAVSDSGELYGGLGMQISGPHANLHSEAFNRPELEAELRQALWEKIQVVALNRGVLRFWTQESAPFWKHYAGFKEAETAERSLLPVGIGDPHDNWLTLVVREETQPAPIIEQQLAWFKAHQQENLNRLQYRAKVVRGTVTLMAFLLFLAVLVAGLYMARKQPLPLMR